MAEPTSVAGATCYCYVSTRWETPFGYPENACRYEALANVTRGRRNETCFA